MSFYTVFDFAKKINVSVETLKELEKTGVLKPFSTLTGRKYYTEHHYKKYIETKNNSNKDIFSLIDFCNAITKVENKQKKYESEKIKQLPEPFYSIKKMREIDKNPFLLDSPEQFCKEAKILHHLNDMEFKNSSPFFVFHKTMFSTLNNQQIIYYIKWRTQVRNNRIPTIDLTCLLLYMSELVNLIEISSIQETFDKLIFLFKKIGNSSIGGYSIKETISKVIKEFWLLHSDKINISLEELKEIIEQKQDKDILFKLINNTQNITLNDLDNVSSHKISKSKFINTSLRNKTLFLRTINIVFKKIDEHLQSLGSSLLLEFVGKKKKTVWLPLASCYYDYSIPISRKLIEYSEYETYHLELGNNYLSREFYGSPINAKKIISYIVKKTEELLRKKLKYSTKISTNKENILISIFYNKKTDKFFKSNEIDELIDSTINNYLKEISVKKYTFNNSNIEKIKNITEMNEDKLIVEDYSLELEKEKQIDDNNNLLTDVELHIIKCLLENKDIYAFCQSKNILMEIVIDNINEKLYDNFSDNIIDFSDSSPYIYEEYIEELKNLLEV